MSLFGKLFRGAAVAASVALSVNSAMAQEPVRLPPPVADLPGLTAPPLSGENPVEPASGFGRSRSAPGCYPSHTPCPSPCPPGQTPPGMAETPPPQLQPVVEPEFGGLGGGAGVGPSVGLGGYIENAAPTTMARVRFDSAYNNNRPDRGEFFYPKSLVTQAGDARGPIQRERSIDYQELTMTGEVALAKRFSVFFNLPIRFLNPDINNNASGLGDISFGSKYAAIYNEHRVVSLFVQFHAPTGSLSQGLGNGNWWIEPGVLYLEQLSSKWQMFSEVRFLSSLSRRSDFTGSLVRYGLGTSYVVVQGQWGYVAPVVEVVGWTVLSGKELNLDSLQPVSASGDTIVNAKAGVRIGLGAPKLGTPYPSRSDIYIGYGRALTGEVWYKDLVRVEFRRFF